MAKTGKAEEVTTSHRRRERSDVRALCNRVQGEKLRQLAGRLARLDDILPLLGPGQSATLLIYAGMALQHLTGLDQGVRLALGLPLDDEPDEPGTPPAEPPAPAGAG